MNNNRYDQYTIKNAYFAVKQENVVELTGQSSIILLHKDVENVCMDFETGEIYPIYTDSQFFYSLSGYKQIVPDNISIIFYFEAVTDQDLEEKGYNNEIMKSYLEQNLPVFEQRILLEKEKKIIDFHTHVYKKIRI